MPTTLDDIPGLLDQLEALHRRSTGNLHDALRAYVESGQPPGPQMRRDGGFAYPELRIAYDALHDVVPSPERAYARLKQPGLYATSVTAPALFRGYLADQLEHLVRDYPVEVSIGLSAEEIPYPYELERAGIDLTGVSSADLSRHFPSPELIRIGDELADGVWAAQGQTTRPLALFDALRTDYSLARLRHYTGTPAGDFQRYVLFTNYIRYVDEFVALALAALRSGDATYDGFSVPGLHFTRDNLEDAERRIAEGSWRRHQMPAYHLMAGDRQGITLVNIGVGPSNAKTICDHLAVVRPEAWMMIGHCGGLRPTQRIGDYVLAHAYLRDDHVLDDVLPPEIPVPAIAEVQVAMARAAEAVLGGGDDFKRRLRTGTVVTTDDRNWELRYSRSALRFSLSRAVGIDMESATIAAQGYRFRVPYGTLLCVSDKPIHGELKLPGQANRFYEEAIAGHLRVGIMACELLREEGERLHSRKLRAFNEPPFR